jgi:hypothetical protein
VAVGEHPGGLIGELPVSRRSAATSTRSVDAAHQSERLQRIEVLANGGSRVTGEPAITRRRDVLTCPCVSFTCIVVNQLPG